MLGIRKNMGRRAQWTDITLRGGPAGEFGRGFVYRGLEKALETGNFLHRGPVKNQGNPNLQRNPNPHQPRSRHRKDCAT